jgi:hypothetical protein
MGSADRTSARCALRCFFLSQGLPLVCRHEARPRAGASKRVRSDGPQWAPHLIDGRESTSQTKACIAYHVHLSLHHRHSRSFPPRRFGSAPCSCMLAGSGKGIVGDRVARSSHARV